jgi:hypothetical protein
MSTDISRATTGVTNVTVLPKATEISKAIATM